MGKGKSGDKEALIQKEILQYLNSLPDTFAVKIQQGPYSYIGISDILCCRHGIFIAIEVKKKPNRPTPLQLEFLRKVSDAGGIGIVAYSVEDVKKIIKGG